MTITAQDHISAALDAAFTLQGEAATYAGTAVTVIPRQPDAVEGLGDTLVQDQSNVFDVRVSEVATPAAGGLLVYNSVTYVVKGLPQTLDPRRLVWTLETRPQ